MGGATKLFRKYGNLQVPRTWRNWHAEPTFAPPKVAVLTVVQVSDAWSAHRTFWLSDQLSVRNYQPRPAEDRPLRAALMELAGQWPTYGYRRLTAMLKRQGRPINTKHVRRLMHELGIVGRAPVRRPRTTDSNHAFPRFPNLVEGLEVERPDQVWVADITYVRLKEDF